MFTVSKDQGRVQWTGVFTLDAGTTLVDVYNELYGGGEKQ